MIKEIQLVANSYKNKFVLNPTFTRDLLKNLKNCSLIRSPLRDEFTSNRLIEKFDIKKLELDKFTTPNVSRKALSRVLFFMPSTIYVANGLANRIKTQEDDGVFITRDDIIEILNKLSKEDIIIEPPENLGRPPEKIRNHQNMYKEYFSHLASIASETKMVKNESAVNYLIRIMDASNDIRAKYEENRIDTIKSMLKYTEESEFNNVQKPLTKEERDEIIRQLQNWHDNLYISIRPYHKRVSCDSTDKELFEAWAKAHIEETKFSLPEGLEKRIIQQGVRYNSSKPQEREQLFINNPIKANNYKQDFKYEPVYHWILGADIDEELPFRKVDDVYITKNTFCCSTNKEYAECDYRDNFLRNNIKLTIHPKSKVSKATLLGFANEVVYPEGTKFKLLHKGFIEYIDEETQISCKRLEVHLQEM